MVFENPLSRASRRAKALGQARRSPIWYDRQWEASQVRDVAHQAATAAALATPVTLVPGEEAAQAILARPAQTGRRRPRHARDRLVRLGRDRLWQRLWQDDTSPLTWAVAYVAAPNRSTACPHAAQPAAAPVFITGRVGKRRHLRQVAYHHLMTHLFGPPLNLVAEGGRRDDTKSSWQFRIVVAVIAHRDAMCGNLQSKSAIGNGITLAMIHEKLGEPA